MIHVDKDACVVTGPMADVVAQLGICMSNMAESIARSGGSKEEFFALLHAVVDIAKEAPASGTTIDLSFQKEG